MPSIILLRKGGIDGFITLNNLLKLSYLIINPAHPINFKLLLGFTCIIIYDNIVSDVIMNGGDIEC